MPITLNTPTNGTLTKITDVNGLATFSDLSINQVTSKRLTASTPLESPPFTPAVSDAFNIYAFQKNGQPISLGQAAPVLSLQIL